MPLTPGEKLGPYEIVAPIGAGGMGEVYKARDTRLDRSVAVKVLPDHIANRDDLRARFEREARAVASLNHPNICTLHDIGPGYMVMELIEGETLAARIEKGAMPLDQALKAAQQIADALDRAHRAGVTHRDVKPGNIMLTRDGVKVLDFGLAKSTPVIGPNDATLTKALTSEGAIVGTPQYMAPELFEGREADVRADIWAFGAVLYEMIAGRKAFQGKNYAGLVGAILSSDPEELKPAWLNRLVKRCLEKDADDRWQSMRDIVLELRAPAQVETETPKQAGYWKWIAAAAGAAAIVLGVVQFRSKPPEAPVLALSIQPPPGAVFIETVISPDGKTLAFTAFQEGKRSLWVRPLHAVEARMLPGTEQAIYPFWSPDSRWIGFFTQAALKKIDPAGGPAQTLCAVQQARGGTWTDDGVILFSLLDTGIHRVSAQGGTPALVSAPDRASEEANHRWPVSLPGGKQFLYLSVYRNDAGSGLYLGGLGDKNRVRLIDTRASGAIAEGPAGDSYLLFLRQGTLMAQRLAPGNGAVTGDAFPVAEKVRVSAVRGDAAFSVSKTGLLVFDSGEAESKQLAWMGRDGKRLGVVGPKSMNAIRPWLSPDEKLVATARHDGQNGDIWLEDLARATSTRFTFGSDHDTYPVWSPDGARIVFGKIGAKPGLFIKNASGTGAETELPAGSPYITAPTDWSRDGRYLLFSANMSGAANDIWLLPMDGERKSAPLLNSRAIEIEGTFSPDGKWIAYTSDESGRFEIYVQPFPLTGAKWQISRDGGWKPRWRRDGREIFWVEEDGTMMAAPLNAGAAIQPGAPVALFETRMVGSSERYAVTADGQRFLVPMPAMDVSTPVPVTLIQNWLAAARR
ncbi:MAG: protein kinase domain-containing protein [Bryobacteraceae bacterium]